MKDGWQMVKFGDVVRQVKDKTDPKTSGLERYIAGRHMDTDDLRLRRWGEINDDYLGPAFTARFRPGQVLYGSRRTYLRKVAVPHFEGICANTTFVLETKDDERLLPELLPFLMQTEPFHDHSIKQSKGSVNPYVNFSDLAWYEFALPPLDEQRRIGRILFIIGQVIESLRDVIIQLENLREPLAKHLFWHRASVIEIAKLIDQEQIPSHWQITNLGDVVKFIGGSQPPRKHFVYDQQSEYIRLLQIRDYKSDDFATYIPIELARKFCDVDDVMIGRYGPPIFQILRGMKGAYNVALIKAEPDQERLTKDYLYYFLNQNILFQLIEHLSQRSSGQTGVEMAVLKRYPILLPPLSEQKVISQQFAEIDTSISNINKRINFSNFLRNKFIFESFG